VLLNISFGNNLFQKLCGTHRYTVWLKTEFCTKESGGTMYLSPGFNPKA